MPEFLEDPSVLTKEKLKGELLANKVPLPSGEQKKEIYVKLYLKYLTARNKNPENFSSDEEAEPAAPIRNRIGRKATRKTDKPRPEEKEDLDVTEMSNEELKEQLIKNGVNPGPITTTTRKLYERRLQKLLEQGPAIKSSGSTPAPASTEDRKQNGNTDSDQYSDNEEETNPEPKVDKREPLKSKTKTPVTVRQRRFEHNQTTDDAESTDVLVLNVKRKNRSSVKLLSQDQAVSSSDIADKVAGNSQVAPVDAVISESSELLSRTSRKRVENTKQVPTSDTLIAQNSCVAETITASSNQAPDNSIQDTVETPSKMSGSSKHVSLQSAVGESLRFSRRTPMKLLTSYEDNFEQDVAETPSKMSGSSEHVPLQSAVYESRLSRRTPMKLLTNYEGNSEQDTAETPSKMSGSSKHVPLQSEVGEYLRFSRRTPMKMPTNYEVIEKTEREERNSGKDVLREMFPYETLTPTGISATCRRPIKGAAGRPVELGEFKLEESIVTKSFTKVVPPAEIKVAKTKSRRSVPIWIQIVLLALVAVFLFLVYEAMEKNEGNPFTAFLGASETSNTAE